MTDSERILENIQEQAANLDGYFQISVKDTGVYLSVFPPQGQGHPVKEASIIQELRNREVENFEYSALIRVIRDAAGTEIKIAEPPGPAPEPEFQILVARDRMEASIQIDMPKGCRKVSLEEVQEKIKNSGVTYGIDESLLQKALERPGVRIVFARGQQPVNGKDGYIHYYIDRENKGRPVELDDGSGKVDFKNLNMFITVRQGETIAQKVSPAPGVDGIDVLGQPVAAKVGKDILPPLGKNVEMTEQKDIVALMPGQVVIVNNKINVIPVIEIKGDVDLSTGNIEFVGNVVVRGSVQAGFTIKAEGNVEIYGTVSGGTVTGKTVVVRMGVQGMQSGSIRAVEDVVAKFIENATVYAGRDVIVNEVILHSRINAGKKVIVEGRRGLIAGGKVMAGEEIRAKMVGTHMAVNTDLEVGVNPELREEYQQIRQEMKKAQFTLEQTQKALAILRNTEQSKLPKEKQEMLLKLTKSQFHLVGQTEAMRNRTMEIELAFEEMKYGRIRVAETIYPGTKIVIGTQIKPIREPLKFVSLHAEDGEIKIGSFK
ncbi:Hypothetical protein LUCI_3332 [Lucifera butyrica]|uniref:Flagellar Assembly Protein A N-terminal region domain-containing protein n=1 Tax=Lucifera butyrica TaxID=1351585 RepID=A0A498RB19_9FIRM|nr:FapA family protein [Lucifera butyrica]VBB08067.1 Hypothetical protein LUCI_3332 [Lucifera butyrica]